MKYLQCFTFYLSKCYCSKAIFTDIGPPKTPISLSGKFLSFKQVISPANADIQFAYFSINLNITASAKRTEFEYNDLLN